MNTLDLDRVKSLLSYDRETGIFSWRVRASNKIKVGDRAGYVGTNGRRLILIEGVKHQAHRVAWFYETGAWPTDDIKQIDGNYDNCAFSNLRVTSRMVGARLRGALSNNTTGFRGVSTYAGDRFQSSITANYKQINLGVFDTAEEASAEYEFASNALAGANTPAACEDALEAITQHRRKRIAWGRLTRSGRPCVWLDFESFCAGIGAMEEDDATVAAVNEGHPIGPGNFRFLSKVKGNFDRSTKEGRAAYMRAYREANPERYRHAHLKSNYDIDDVEFERMKVAQNGKCLICAETPDERLAVDHSHHTKEVRGLLCKRCNYALGQFGDNLPRIRSAVEYLERYEVVDRNPVDADRDWLHVATLGFGT